MEQDNKENINSTNEEHENLDSTNEEQTAEEVEESTETENEENTKKSSDDTSDESEFTDREKRLYARAKKAEEELKELRSSEQKEKPKTKKESPEEILVARLEARGVLEADDQSFVLKYAKVEGISPIEALEEEFVQDRLKANEQRRKSSQAAPRNNNRAAKPADEVAVAVKRYKQDGSLPENNPALTAKVLRALKTGA